MKRTTSCPPTNWSLPILASVVFITMMLMSVLPDTSLAEDGDVNEFYKTLEKISQPVIDLEKGKNAIRRGEDIKRRTETEQVVEALDNVKQEWRDLVQQLDKELKEVFVRAERDAGLQAWAKFFQVLSIVVSLASEESKSKATVAPSESAQPKDGLHIREQYQRVIKLCKDGKCETIDLREVINRASKASAGLKDTDVLQIQNRLLQATAILPSLHCDPGGERCIPLHATTGIGTVTIAKPDRTTSSFLENKVYKQVVSLVADLSPGIGTAKAFLELGTGKDPITGEDVGKVAAGMGIVAGAMPAGKTLIKVVKKGVKYIGRHIKGPRVFRHYTSRIGSKGIAREGMIRAGKDHEVYVVDASEKVWLRYDAEINLNLKGGRGRDYVEFRLPQGLHLEKHVNPNIGTNKAYQIRGDIPLNPKEAVIIQRGD